MSSNVVEIVPKDLTVGMWGISRKVLQEAMEQHFGPLVYCKKPPASGNPAEDIAFVQFREQQHAEKAVESLKDGMPLGGAAGMKLYSCEITGHFKGGGKGNDNGKYVNNTNWNPDLKDSRALMLDKSKRRSRSRSRGARRDSRDRRDRRRCDDRRDARGRRELPAIEDRRGHYDEGRGTRRDSRDRRVRNDSRDARDRRGYDDRRDARGGRDMPSIEDMPRESRGNYNEDLRDGSSSYRCQNERRREDSRDRCRRSEPRYYSPDRRGPRTADQYRGGGYEYDDRNYSDRRRSRSG